ncbi:MAG: PKD domain-containing protein [Planctomycetes bacterium]|nr:PKD domain-containing protein [Planctomycetota bacterium]
MNRHLLAPLGLCLALGAPLAAQTLTTTFAGGNGGNVGGAVHFDLTVVNTAGIVVNRFDVNCSDPASTTAGFDVYMTDVGGTYSGNQVNPAPGIWHLAARADVVTTGSGNPTAGLLDKPIVLPAGNYGVTIAFRGCATRYTNGTMPTQTYSNGDLQLTLGTAQNVPFSSGIFSPRIANLTCYYSVIAADVVDFSVDVPTGASPLVATFTDRTVTSSVVAAWAWDFQDDGTVDSTLQNPTFVYPACGDYSVRLTATTGSGIVSRLWTDLMSVDPLAADFSANPEVGPPPLANVQFTDASTGTVQSWAWDFDDDGVVDSTLQNPATAFGPGAHAVTLTVTNGCRVESRTRRITAATDSFATTYNANSFINRWGVVMFDLAVTSTEALSVCAIDCNSYTPAGNPMDIEIFLTDGSAVGKETTPEAWRRVATATGITPGGNQPARVVLDRPILLLPGRSYGVGVYHNGNAAYYFNASTPLSNADLMLTPVAAAYVPNGPFTVTPQFAPRQWVGEIHYNKESMWPQGVVTFFAPGCAGSQPVAQLAATGTSRPQLGTSTTLQVDNLPVNAGILMIGVSDTISPFGPLPLPLGPFGMPGCTAYASPDANVLMLGAGGSAQFTLALPNNPTFAGIHYYMQTLVLDPGVNAQGAVVSDAIALLTGTF